jgi:hypothetical protein
MEGTHILTKLRMFIHQTPALMSLGQSNVGWGEKPLESQNTTAPVDYLEETLY